MKNPMPEPDPLETLRRLRRTAPADFTKRVMDALPREPDLPLGVSLRQLWPERSRWFLPALAGAAAMLCASPIGIADFSDLPVKQSLEHASLPKHFVIY